MMDKHTPATLNLYQRLRAAERAQDRSIRITSDLLTTMMDTHAEVGIPYLVGHEAIERTYRAIGKGIEGRRELGRSHGSMVPIARALGVDWTMGGDVGNTQDDFFEPTGQLNGAAAEIETDSAE